MFFLICLVKNEEQETKEKYDKKCTTNALSSKRLGYVLNKIKNVKPQKYSLKYCVICHWVSVLK